jgi:hypothetical protein
MKNFLIVLAVLVVGALGYFAYTQFAPVSTTTDTPTTQEPQGSGVQAKINIDAVCQGALAYMSFPDGATADAFVAECKEGKHPEVIEKYKADLNLGSGVAI